MNRPLTPAIRTALAKLILMINTPEARFLALSCQMTDPMPESCAVLAYDLSDAERAKRLVAKAFYDLRSIVNYELPCVYSTDFPRLYNLDALNVDVHNFILTANTPDAARQVAEVILYAANDDEAWYKYDPGHPVDAFVVKKTLNLMFSLNDSLADLREEINSKEVK